MPTPLNRITSVSAGAAFYRADLHVHSVNSHDVSDSTATPEGIVNTALAEGLNIIAITDHNAIGGVDTAVTAGTSRGLMVVPGVELSTPEGHALFYFRSVDLLSKFFHSLTIAGSGASDLRCDTSLMDCLDKASALDGMCILAHVDGPKGLEHENKGVAPKKVAILTHGCVHAIEIVNPNSQVSFSQDDPDVSRREIGNKRRVALGTGPAAILARVHFSDAHTLAALTRNANTENRVTRLKMQTPSFDGLRAALREADSRVRIEALLPDAVPHIKGLAMDGGFLDQTVVHFSRNLNCLIGGKGSGKSTIIEALRCGLNQTAEASDNRIDSDVWPIAIHIVWDDGNGTPPTTIRRDSWCPAEIPESGDAPSRQVFPIECYSQGETASIGRSARTDASGLLDILDRVIEHDPDLETEEGMVIEALDQNSVLMAKLEDKVSKIGETKTRLAQIGKQLRAAEQLGAKDALTLERQLAGERAARKDAIAVFKGLSVYLKSIGINKFLDDLDSAVMVSTPVFGKDQFEALKARLRELDRDFVTNIGDMNANTKAFFDAAKEDFVKWQDELVIAQQDVDRKRVLLKEQNVDLDLANLEKLVNDEAQLKRRVADLEAARSALTQATLDREKLLNDLWSLRGRRTTKRVAFAKRVSRALKVGFDDGVSISLKYRELQLSPAIERMIIDAMEWRTNQQPRARAIVEYKGARSLLDGLRKGTVDLSCILRDGGSTVFSKKEAMEIARRLSQHRLLRSLEVCLVADLPVLIVSKTIELKDGTVGHKQRPFASLSAGQQQAVLLALVLLSESRSPLIIDQPEDNLDGQFIYGSLVSALRLAKERRQIIVATHNANIAVLGDAELIVSLNAKNDIGVVSTRGSIDDEPSRRSACNILEGSDEAFRRRSEIYGYGSQYP